MANALPVIATSVGGVVDLLGEPLPSSLTYLECTRGVSVPPNDEQAFAEGLLRLIQDSDLRNRLGQNGRDYVKVNYARERLIDDIKGLYNELISTQPLKLESKSAVKQSFQSGA
jgi:glycosyltransferase involved in cell wall biosynthesis